MTCAFPTPAIDAPAGTPTPSPGHGWTRERRVLFLDRLAANGNARAACRAVGLSAEAAYRLRRRDPLFARAWRAAVLLGRDASVQHLGCRAIDGIEEDVWFRGEVVGTRRRYDTRLLLAHLARLDALADEEGARDDAAQFDHLLACIGRGDGEVAPPDRQQFVAEAGERAAEAAMRRDLTLEPDEEGGEPVEIAEKDLWLHFGDDADALREALYEACDEAEDEARCEAEDEWERRYGFGAVDALCEAAAAQRRAAPEPHVALLPAPPAASEALACFTAPASTPCTPSTPSTSALARVLAGPPRGYVQTPRSPKRTRC